MNKIKLGVLGVSGHFIHRCLRPLKTSTIVDVHAVASRDLEKAKACAEKYDIPVYYGSYEECLCDPEIDIVYIPLPNHLHLDWIKRSADAGKHIICEKPVALTAEDAYEAVEYARNSGVLIMEAFMYRFHPQWKAVRELVNYGEIGAIQSVHTFFGYNNSDPVNIRNIKESGGGALLDIGCYAVSVPRYVFGIEPERVFCSLERDSRFGTDIHTSAIMDFGSGKRASFTISTQTFTSQSVEIHGTGGIIKVCIPFNAPPDVQSKIIVSTGLCTREISVGPADQFGLEFDSFARAVRGESVEINSPEDAVNNMKVLDALLYSSEHQGWQEV